MAEQGHHFAGIEIKRGVVDGVDAAEGDRDVLHRDEGRAGAVDMVVMMGGPVILDIVHRGAHAALLR